MQKTSEIMIEYQQTKLTAKGDKIRVKITDKSKENDYDAFMEEKHIVFKMKEKLYIIDPSSKMQPRYTSNNKI